ncbi:LuxR family transcriptional regulator [Streptomyces sp. NBC_00289]|uniref:helix-turn-helix transcriptional regulator n=1 Tax=Streptomyces sp. NBC_00289 TaxID=2975703 RepID=UPI00324AFEE6
MTAHTEATAAPRLQGGETARRAVTAVLDRLRTTSAVLVIAGEPGLGRTTLLDEAVRRFTAGPVLHVRCEEPESRLPYGGMRALIRAVAALTAAPSAAAPSAAAPSAAAPESGVGAEELLAALGAVAVDVPLLVCVDDVHRWGASSRAVLRHAAGRLHPDGRVGLIVSVAQHRGTDQEFIGLPMVELEPLDPSRAAALLDEVTDATIDPCVRDALVEEAEGNPALLLALTRRMSSAQLRGRRALPSPPADAEMLARVLGEPPNAFVSGRDDLLLTAAAALREAEDADVELLATAAGRPASAAMITTVPVTAGSGTLPDGLVLADGRFRFTSRLLRKAVYAGASADRRHRAHLALAGRLEARGELLPALLHRSWSLSDRAPQMAAELAAAGADMTAPVSHRLRSVAYARAAELTVNGADRAERYTAAAEQALLAGRPHRALRLLSASRACAAPAAVHGRAELVRGRTELRDGPVADAHASLLLAATLLDTDAPDQAALARLAAGDAAWSAGDREACLAALADGWTVGEETGVTPGAGADLSALSAGTSTPTDAPCPASAPLPTGAGSRPGVGAGPGSARFEPGPARPRPGRSEPDAVRDYRLGMRAVLEGRLDRAARPLGRVVGSAESEDDPERLLRSASAALLLGRIGAARRAGARALAAARARGSAVLVPQALEYLAYAELRAGRHAQARTHAEEGLRAAYGAGQRNTAAHHHAVLALAASIEGHPAVVGGQVTAALATARRHGLAQVATLAEWAAARADLGRGRPVDAADRLGPVVRPGSGRGHFAVWMLAAPCFVEAAVLAGRPADALTVVADFAVWADFGADPQAPAQLVRCRALLAEPDRADALYGRALALHEVAGGDFERARTALLYGRWLRRRRRLREARGHLGAALVGFERCGAAVWAEQARGELRANGTAPLPAGAGTLRRLTPQQLRIAGYVAQGATNREVALSLAVSTRTVDYHLRNIFAVLGVRSRMELARMVEQAEKTAAQP